MSIWSKRTKVFFHCFCQDEDSELKRTRQAEIAVLTINFLYMFSLSPLDVDECAVENECDSNALCTNTEGSYVCRCVRGYEGDGKYCIGITRVHLKLSLGFVSQDDMLVNELNICPDQ